MHPPSLPPWLSLAPQSGLSLPTSKVQTEARGARLQALGRGFSRAGSCVGRKQGRDPLRGCWCGCPPITPNQGESPRFGKGLSRQHPIPLPAWEQAWRKGGGPRAEPQGALCLSISRGPPEDVESALGSQGPSSLPPNSQVSTQWGATSRHPRLLCWRPSPHPPSVPRHTPHPHRPESQGRGRLQSWWRGEGAVMGGAGQMFLEWDTG